MQLRTLSSSESDSSDDDQVPNTPVTRSQTPSDQSDVPDDQILAPSIDDFYEDNPNNAFLAPEVDNLNEVNPRNLIRADCEFRPYDLLDPKEMVSNNLKSMKLQDFDVNSVYLKNNLYDHSLINHDIVVFLILTSNTIPGKLDSKTWFLLKLDYTVATLV